MPCDTSLYGATVTVAGAAVTLATFRTGAFATAKGGAAVVGDLFVMSNDVDLTSTPLETAKGSAPVAYDVFRWTNVGSGTEAIEYVGNVYSAGFGVDVAF